MSSSDPCNCDESKRALLPLAATLTRVAESVALQSTEDKLEVLTGVCGDQAAQAVRAGRVVDAAEWNELKAWIRGLG